MQRLYILASVAFCVASATAFSAEWKPPTTEVPKDDAAYITKAKTAAPPSVANNATPGSGFSSPSLRLQSLHLRQ